MYQYEDISFLRWRDKCDVCVCGGLQVCGFYCVILSRQLPLVSVASAHSIRVQTSSVRTKWWMLDWKATSITLWYYLHKKKLEDVKLDLLCYLVYAILSQLMLKFFNKYLF